VYRRRLERLRAGWTGYAAGISGPLPPPLGLRPGRPDDLAFLQSLAPRLVAALPEWRDRAEAQAQTEALFAQVLAATPETPYGFTAVLVAELEGRPAGFALLYLLPGEETTFIKDFAVSTEAEGQGVARFLMDGVRTWAAGHGCREIHLKTNWDNARARAFYERAGFEAEYVTMVRPV